MDPQAGIGPTLDPLEYISYRFAFLESVSFTIDERGFWGLIDGSYSEILRKVYQVPGFDLRRFWGLQQYTEQGEGR